MSFLKSLMIAIFVTLFLTYVLGSGFMQLFDIDVYMGDELIEPLKAISISALISVIIVIAVLAIILSVFGTIIFVGLIVVGSLAMVAIGVFWPLLLIAGAIWIVTKDKKQQYNQ
ncbi:hypothetical protein [Thalassotalea fusca]